MNYDKIKKAVGKSKISMEDLKKVSGGARIVDDSFEKDPILLFAMNMCKRVGDLHGKASAGKELPKSYASDLDNLKGKFFKIVLNRLSGLDATKELEEACIYHQELFTKLDQISSF